MEPSLTESNGETGPEREETYQGRRAESEPELHEMGGLAG